MKLAPTGLPGAFLIDIEPRRDERGFFARTYCAATLEAHGLVACGRQWSLSQNVRRGTTRGLHYQADPHGETKIVRCVRGAVFDVIVDIRPGSPTFGQHVAVELTAESYRALYIPAGFAHGFQTLADDSELLYAITPDYVAEAARGVRWNDPALGIAWPLAPTVLSERDAQLPLLRP